MSSETCYYCGGLATTREHVPPKQMFKNFNCDSITVPSCKEHNCSKGGHDQAIVTALLTAFKSKSEKDPNNREYFNNYILTALNAAKSSFERTKHRVIRNQLVDLEDEKLKLLPELGFIKSPISIKGWIRNLTAGIIYNGIGMYDSSISWDKMENWSPDFLKGKLNEKKSLNEVGELLMENSKYKTWFESFNWLRGWSAHPRKYPQRIYYFLIAFDENEVLVKHKFYENYNWYAWFTPSLATIKRLKRKLRNVKTPKIIEVKK